MIYQQLINGLMLGASYSLVAIGYTLIFGVLRLLYFAHGEVFMVGAFIGLFSVVFAGFGISGALLGAMIGCAALAVVAYFVTVRPVPAARRRRLFRSRASRTQASTTCYADQLHRPDDRSAEPRRVLHRRQADGISRDHRPDAVSPRPGDGELIAALHPGDRRGADGAAV